jgi:phosphoglycerol transferase MdoB-like AlkP superfamily enzyme
VFAGGFGSSHVIDRPRELMLFALGLIFAHALLIGLLYLAIRALHRKSRDNPIFLLNFLFFTGGGSAALLFAKYEVLSYFSDALGFELIKSLGGGSLADAMLFVANDAALALLAIAGAIAAWWAGTRLARRFLPDRVATVRLGWRHLLLLALSLPLVAAAAVGEPDVRYALSRFNAFGLANQAMARASDFDGDGYSWFTPQRDAFPFDSARHPYVLDIPENGIDEDGFGGDLRLAGASQAVAAPSLPPDPRHLVVVVLESVRGDAIGKMVDGRPVTPVLNALARNGSYSPEAYSHVGFTTESLKSLFSGSLDVAPGDPSLFRDLKAHGYRIGVYSGQPESFGGISEAVGMKEKADIFVDADTLKAQRAFSFAAKGSLLIDGRILLSSFDRSFRGAGDWARPTFLYFNFQEAHFPYSHPGTPRLLPGRPVSRGEISAENREQVERTYWNAVAYDDWLVGQLIARLKRMGVWEETLLLVTADHGESLFDDDFLGHGHVINRQQTQIPLILSRPGIDIPRPVGLSDYRSLILRALGANVAIRNQGRVFQHISALRSPAVIGTVEKGGVWTTFELETQQVRLSDQNRNIRYSDLPAASPERKRADRLIDDWGRARWLARR